MIDEHQRNPTYPEVFGIGVCVAIPPVGPTPVPVGTPKTGFMIESMVTATAVNIGRLLRGEQPKARATWNAVCLADFGDGGVAFVAQPQIPPRNVNWSAKGQWVHLAKVAFEKYFLRKMRTGQSEPFYESFLLRQLDIAKLKEIEVGSEPALDPRRRVDTRRILREFLNWRNDMSLDRSVLVFAGVMVLLSVVLTVWVSPLFVWFTVFIGLNLLQSAFTGFCPAAAVFRRLGVKPGTAF